MSSFHHCHCHTRSLGGRVQNLVADDQTLKFKDRIQKL